VRGKDTSGKAAAPAAAAPLSENAAATKLAADNGCMACHGKANKIVGPGYNEVAAKYKGQADAESKLVAKLKAGGQGVWGAIPMPPQTQLKDEDARRLVKWILSGAKAQ
jgi:cytochrome c